ncbi:Ig-like domain repeat protein [Acidovorax sp. JMULE5]|jgi:hypothetical protein|uniref:IPTL-CTERM sorting domain-containing protein n=1 Tax=Acidovorax sp. JMULE5 TaxID=2518343 RepID=UPI0015A2450A|nr:IPTL-CTERM sorting domain-containing protein [Acidovorax sp. JMULE5]QLA83676.1 Ig-like domain repeat protein [Acidovorax sp. JMULE5]
MLVLFLAFLVVQGAWAQPVVTYLTPMTPNSPSPQRAPNGTAAYTYLRAVFIVPAQELQEVHANVTLQSLGFLLSNGTNADPGTPAQGSFRLYLQNTTDSANLKPTDWASIVAGMTEAYNGTFVIPSGNSPATVELPTAGFTYSGAGLYVAYEYTGTSFATQPAMYASNTSIPSSIFNISSASAMPPDLSFSSSFRPQLQLRYANPHPNDLNVEWLSGMAYPNKLWGNPSVFISMKNGGANDQSASPVTVQLTGANVSSAGVDAGPILAGATTTTSLTLNAPNTGLQTVTATAPADDYLPNNQKSLAQNISCDAIAYAGLQTPSGSVGFDIGTGILAVRYTAPGAPILVDKVFFTLHNDGGNVGRTLEGRVLDGNGQIIGTSAPRVTTIQDLGQRVELALLTPVRVEPGVDFYAGVLQMASAQGYSPVATESPTGTAVPANRYFLANAAGGSLQSETNSGEFQIGANVRAAVDWLGSAPVAAPYGVSQTLTAAAGFSSYRFIVNGTAQQQGASSSFTYAPSQGDVVGLEATLNGCDYPAVNIALQTMPVPLVLRANDLSKVYGQTLALNGTEFSATGLQLGDTVGSAAISSSGATAGASVVGGPYPILISNAVGGTFAPANYTISYQPGQLTVARAATAITTAPPTAPTAGQPVTLTANVGVISPGAGNPSGTVMLSLGGQSCTALVTGSTASCDVTPVYGGSLPLQASYAGDGNFSASAAPVQNIQVQGDPAPSAVAIPTLAQWSTAALSALLALFGLAFARRQQR